jgi:nitroreductase
VEPEIWARSAVVFLVVTVHEMQWCAEQPEAVLLYKLVADARFHAMKARVCKLPYRSFFISPPPHMSDILSALNWRYACKVFDASKTIPTETWEKLEQSLILTPSSFGLQPWKFLVIQDRELREKLVPHAWNQRQVADCSHLVVMTVPKVLSVEHIDANITRMVEVRGGTADALMGFRKMVVGFREGLDAKGGLETWAKLQSYIALGQFMLAAALLEVDTCPMEGFIPAKFDEVLGLEDTGYTCAVLCPAGYRSADDRYASLPKVRFETKDIIEHR